MFTFSFAFIRNIGRQVFERVPMGFALFFAFVFVFVFAFGGANSMVMVVNSQKDDVDGSINALDSGQKCQKCGSKRHVPLTLQRSVAFDQSVWAHRCQLSTAA